MPTCTPALPNARLTARPIPPEAPVIKIERGRADGAPASHPDVEGVVITGIIVRPTAEGKPACARPEFFDSCCCQESYDTV